MNRSSSTFTDSPHRWTSVMLWPSCRRSNRTLGGGGAVSSRACTATARPANATMVIANSKTVPTTSERAVCSCRKLRIHRRISLTNQKLIPAVSVTESTSPTNNGAPNGSGPTKTTPPSVELIHQPGGNGSPNSAAGTADDRRRITWKERLDWLRGWRLPQGRDVVTPIPPVAAPFQQLNFRAVNGDMA